MMCGPTLWNAEEICAVDNSSDDGLGFLFLVYDTQSRPIDQRDSRDRINIVSALELHPDIGSIWCFGFR